MIKRLSPETRATIRRLRLSLALLLDRRLGLLLTVDGLVLFSITIAVLTGEGTAAAFYVGLVLVPTLFLGVPILADVIALERRAGSLDLALSSPGARSYFERRLLSFTSFLIVQGALLILFARFSLGRFPLWAALIQATLIPLLLASIILFWGVRVRTTGAVIFASVVTFAALGQWTFANPIQTFAVTQGTATLETVLVWAKANAVIAIAAIIFYLYARRRLMRPETLLSCFLLIVAGCAPEEPLARAPEPIPVRTEVATPAAFQPTLMLLGSVRPSETIPLTTVTGGRISYARRFSGGLRGGEEVRAGEALAYFENENARHTLAEARLVAESAEYSLDRSRSGFAGGIISQSELAQRETESRLAKERLASAERLAQRRALIAPRGGRLIVRQMIAPSTELAAGTVVAEIAAGGRPRVVAPAPASAREKLRPGLEVRFGTTARGILSEIAPVVDEAGSIRIVADVSDATGLPAPGEGIEVTIALDLKPNAITIPDDALIIGSSGSAVFVAEAGSMGGGTLRARRVVVELGGRGDGRTEVTRGLKAGDRVVVSGAAFLSDGARVIATEKDT